MSDGNRRFFTVLLLICAVALAWRVGYTIVAKRNQPLSGDQIYYSDAANTLADGHGFVEPVYYSGPTAEHPPLTALVLAPVAYFRGHTSGVLPKRLKMTLFGTAVVFVIGLIGREVAGDRTGWIAAGLAAVYPELWMNDALVMSETLATLAVALVILGLYRFWRRPRWLTAAGIGLCSGLAMLARAELGLVLVFAVAPVILLVRSLAFRRRLGHLAASVLVSALVAATWVGPNLVRFQRPVLFSTNDGLTLCGANNQHIWYGDGIGFWSFECAFYGKPPGDQSVVSDHLEHLALGYVHRHLSRVPLVVVYREARTWSLYTPGAMAWYNTGEGREKWASWLGFAMWWALVPVAAAGAVALRRRRVLLIPLLAQFLMVIVIVALIYGLVRFRVTAEISVVVLAAAAIDAWVSGTWPPRRRGVPVAADPGELVGASA